ncbi:MAG: TetR/AcrR family transcriptional regulator [Deltaproteobacteria bacterium]|nr:TetR/AcrR family transcriptional regulator [Deltaproteobacteria bacterium]
MGRKARYDKEQFIGGALKILAERGPAGVTMNAVAEETGAPIGSVYHRFVSRDVLMAELWFQVVESFQRGFLIALEQGDGLEAALHTPRWVREHPKEGRVLLLHRRDDFSRGEWPDDIKAHAVSLAAELRKGIRSFVRKKFGRMSKRAMDRTVFVLVDAPHAAVRRYLESDEVPPDIVDELIRETYYAVYKEDL